MPTSIQYPTLQYKEAALLSGEKTEPTWKSPNELIHERVNFDDTIWGFGLVGGAHYQTPLRVTYVRKGSRAQKAHIYPGDIVLKINGMDSTQVTLQKAHQMILDAGIHLIINVTAPEDEEDSYYFYQDPLIDEENEEQEQEEILEERKKVTKPYSKCSHWALQWPWKCKRKIIWKESNCYMVPSKYVEKHGDRLLPEVKQGDIVLDSIYNDKERTNSSEAEGVSSNTVNENSEHDNEETKSIGSMDKNNEFVSNDGEETDAYFDKFENGLPGMSESDKIVTNEILQKIPSDTRTIHNYDTFQGR